MCLLGIYFEDVLRKIILKKIFHVSGRGYAPVIISIIISFVLGKS
jgi:hypothetical protein